MDAPRRSAVQIGFIRAGNGYAGGSPAPWRIPVSDAGMTWLLATLTFEIAVETRTPDA